MILRSKLTKTLLASLLAVTGFAASAQEKVTVQLKWLPSECLRIDSHRPLMR